MENKERIERLAELGDQVAKQHETYEEALETESQTEAALLATVIERIKPSLRALGGRELRFEQNFSNNSGTHQREKNEHHDFRSVTVAGIGKQESGEQSAGRGEIYGDKLELVTRDGGGEHVKEHGKNGAIDYKDRLVTGDLVRITYDGRWSRWQGDGDKWDTTARVLTYSEAIDQYGLDAILESLEEALTSQITGKKTHRTSAAWKRSTMLQALKRLVKSGAP